MLAPKYMTTLRTVLSALMLVPSADRVPGLSGWRHTPAR
jgi:hypothetical protein